MSLLDDEFFRKAEIALRTLDAQPQLAAAVQAEVDLFFGRYPALQRTRPAEAFITSLVIERLSTAAGSQPAAQPKTQKVA